MAPWAVHSSFPKIVVVWVEVAVVVKDEVAVVETLEVAVDVSEDVADVLPEVVADDVCEVVAVLDCVDVAVVEGDVISQDRKMSATCIWNALFKEFATSSHADSPFAQTIVPSLMHSIPNTSSGEPPKPVYVNS